MNEPQTKETPAYRRRKKAAESPDKAREADQHVDQENEDFIAEFLAHQTLDQLEKDAGVVVEKFEDADDKSKPPAPKSKNYLQRCVLGVCLISLLSTIVYLGSTALSIFIVWVYLTAVYELVCLGFVVFNFKNNRRIKLLGWTFCLLTYYLQLGAVFERRLGPLTVATPLARFLHGHHYLISFAAYVVVVALFLYKAEGKELNSRLSLLAYITLTLMTWSAGAYHLENSLDGMIWFLYPVTLSVFNDIMAYVFGIFVGRTQLIELSPKKTWEGFVGSAVTTLVFSFYLASVMGSSPHITCPVEYDFDPASQRLFRRECQPRKLFQKELRTFSLPQPLGLLAPTLSVHMSPFQVHGFFISLFVSFLSPFGGFFASGFKRAFKIKDFGRLIPGHGGFNDRFDCNMFTSFFMIAYMNTFIQTPGPAKLYNEFLRLGVQEQADFLAQVKAQFLPD